MEPDDQWEVIRNRMNALQERITNARYELNEAAKDIDQLQKNVERMVMNNAGAPKE